MQFVHPKATVACVTGEGSIQMNIQELSTCLQYNLPIKVISLNNRYLGMVRQWQELFLDKRYSSVDMHNPDFVGIAKAYGIPGQHISRREDLKGALQKLLENHSNGYLLEVKVGKENNVFPMVPQGCSVAEIRLK